MQPFPSAKYGAMNRSGGRYQLGSCIDSLIYICISSTLLVSLVSQMCVKLHHFFSRDFRKRRSEIVVEKMMIDRRRREGRGGTRGGATADCTAWRTACLRRQGCIYIYTL